MTWTEANQRFLTSAVGAVRARVTGAIEAPPDQASQVEAVDLPAPSALDTLAEIFELSSFEREILLLAAGAELDPVLAELRPTLALAMSKLRDPHWTALTPWGALRHWRMIRITEQDKLLDGTLRIDERVLHYLCGVTGLDQRLQGYVTPLNAPEASESETVDRIAAEWKNSGPPRPVVLCGSDPVVRRAMAARAANMCCMRAFTLDAELLPSAVSDFEELLTIWDREAAMSNAILVLECDRAVNENAILRWMERTRNELIVSTDIRRISHLRPALILDVPHPGWAEQWALWQAEEGPRVAARPKLEHLAQRIHPAAAWNDLVLPNHQLDTLREIAMHVHQRARVYDEWGFASKSSRGLGISALFAGASGTGKTMAAEVLARDLNLDLYRVDLSEVVSKYIGETEKNLRKVFDAAEHGGAILLFDEADALFGKRSEVKDSHDRYANVEISYLLQRMEAYRGLAILTTNMKSALDQAFQRRIRFIVEFPFPDAASRAEIWRRVFPAATPVNGVDRGALARMNIAGGNIRNIALSAAFRAASEGEPVHMSHILHAARAEYLKMERPLGEIEMGAPR